MQTETESYKWGQENHTVDIVHILKCRPDTRKVSVYIFHNCNYSLLEQSGYSYLLLVDFSVQPKWKMRFYVISLLIIMNFCAK